MMADTDGADADVPSITLIVPVAAGGNVGGFEGSQGLVS